MAGKKTVVLVASPKAGRYSNLATQRLNKKGFEVVPVGYTKGSIDGIEIVQDFPHIEDVHTITLYLNPQRQKALYDYILSLNPKRIIFNPGTENLELQKLAEDNGIITQVACTLVLLNLQQY